MTDEKKSAIDQLDDHAEAHENAIAEIYLAAAKSGSAGYTLKLIDPIMLGTEKVTELRFRVPTVRDMRRPANPEAELESSIEFAAAACERSVTVEQLKQLSFDDWEAVQAVLRGFAKRRVAGGPARSTKTT